jgi:carbonic anhydrase
MLYTTLFFASTATATCLHGLSMFAKRAENAEGGVEVKTFGYSANAATGPFNWATLAVENEACKAGSNQSPINLGKSYHHSTDEQHLSCRLPPLHLVSNNN